MQIQAFNVTSFISKDFKVFQYADIDLLQLRTTKFPDVFKYL